MHAKHPDPERGSNPTAPAEPARGLTLAACLAGIFSSTFTITILGVSLKPIADDLGSDVATVAWVMTGPMLAQALSMPVLGKLGDLYGHRRVYLLGFLVAGIAAAVTALAWDAPSLVVFRCIGQLAGTATMPASTALLFNVYGPGERVRAMGWVSLVSAGAPVLGLAVGGVLVDQFGWRPIFLLQAGLSAVAIVFAASILRETRHSAAPHFDAPGAATLAAAAFCLTFAINRSPVWGVTDPGVWAPALLVPFAIWGFIRVEHRSPFPLLPLEFFRDRNFSAPLVAGFCVNFAYMGGFIITPLLLLEVFSFSATKTSLIIVCRPAAFAFTSALAGRVAGALGERATAMLGGAMLLAGMLAFCLAAVDAHAELAAPIGAIITGLVVAGLGFGFLQPALQAIVGNAVSASHFGIASSALGMAGSVGAVAGISFLTALCADATDGEPFLFGYALGVGSATLALIATACIRGRPGSTARAPATTPGPPPVAAR